jgi:hypothetical protein
LSKTLDLNVYFKNKVALIAIILKTNKPHQGIDYNIKGERPPPRTPNAIIKLFPLPLFSEGNNYGKYTASIAITMQSITLIVPYKMVWTIAFLIKLSRINKPVIEANKIRSDVFLLTFGTIKMQEILASSSQAPTTIVFKVNEIPNLSRVN